MTRSTDVSQPFAQLMVTLAAAFPSTKLSEAQIRVYFDALGDVPIATLGDVCRRAIKDCTWFPSAAELRRYVAPGTDDAALIAWSALSKAAAIIGGYQSVDIDDPCAASALLLVFGGWPAFCAAEDGPALGQRRQEFLAAYRAARRHVHGAVAPTRLRGLLAGAGQPDRAWVGRITAGGEVHATREPSALPAADEREPINRLGGRADA